MLTTQINFTTTVLLAPSILEQGTSWCSQPPRDTAVWCCYRPGGRMLLPGNPQVSWKLWGMWLQVNVQLLPHLELQPLWCCPCTWRWRWYTRQWHCQLQAHISTQTDVSVLVLMTTSSPVCLAIYASLKAWMLATPWWLG